jgi:anti-sigma factor ChrR (cupin superfamily)
MTHDLSDEITERAALYALGTLPLEESLAFEKHISQECALCAAELQAFEEVCVQLALTAPEVEPLSHVLERLMRKVGQTKHYQDVEPVAHQVSPSTLLTIYAEEGDWQELSKGVFVKQLYADEKKGIVTSLYKMLPGAHAPTHRHLGVEECVVLEGDFHLNDLVLGPGDYHRAEAGTVHQTLYSEKGNLLLIISPQEGFQALAVHCGNPEAFP